MVKASKFLNLIIITAFSQICVIAYIVFAYNDPYVPIHFSFVGAADSLGNASEYFLLIAVNLLVYALTYLAGKYAKIDVDKFKNFENKEPKNNV